MAWCGWCKLLASALMFCTRTKLKPLWVIVNNRGLLFTIVKSRKWKSEIFFLVDFFVAVLINSSSYCPLYQLTSYVCVIVGFVAFPSVCGICILVSICTIFSCPHNCCQVICSLHLNIALPQAFALQELNFVLLDNCKSGSDISWCFDPWGKIMTLVSNVVNQLLSDTSSHPRNARTLLQKPQNSAIKDVHM